MSEPYAPTTNVAPTSPVTLLDNGDSVTFASLMAGIVAPLWDGVFYLLNHIGGPALTELLAGGPYTWQGDQTWAGAQTWQNDNTHEGAETFLGEAITLRQNVGLVNLGTIAANTQIANTVGIVYTNQPGSNTSYNIALPAPAEGHPIIYVRFSGVIAGSRSIYVTNTANLAVANPADYYGLWGPSAAAGGYAFGWTGARWEILTAFGGVSAGGGGTLA
jgi:hypothetical protein